MFCCVRMSASRAILYPVAVSMTFIDCDTFCFSCLFYSLLLLICHFYAYVNPIDGAGAIVLLCCPFVCLGICMACRQLLVCSSLYFRLVVLRSRPNWLHIGYLDYALHSRNILHKILKEVSKAVLIGDCVLTCFIASVLLFICKSVFIFRQHLLHAVHHTCGLLVLMLHIAGSVCLFKNSWMDWAAVGVDWFKEACVRWEVQIGTTWQIQLNDLCALVMQSYIDCFDQFFTLWQCYLWFLNYIQMLNFPCQMIIFFFMFSLATVLCWRFFVIYVCLCGPASSVEKKVEAGDVFD